MRKALIATTLGLLAVGHLWPAMADAEPWPIKSFEVVAVEPAAQIEGNHYYIEDFVRLLREIGFDPDKFPGAGYTVNPSEKLNKLAIEIEDALALAAHFYEDQGFRIPALEPIVDHPDTGERAYRVYLLRGMENTAGRYHPYHCTFDARGERVILLDFDNMQKNYTLTASGFQIAAHELFHAVQHGSPFFQGCNQGAVGPWIVEGTADTAAWYAALRHKGSWVLEPLWQNHAPRVEVWGLRNYSNSLPVARKLTGTQGGEAYGTSSFWTYLAEYEGTSGRPSVPGTNPKSLKFLSRLFESAPVERRCHQPNADCRAEVEWLDKQLELLFGKPLRELYSPFIGAFSLYGNHRMHNRADWDSEWIESAFADEGCIPVELRPESEKLQIETHVSMFKRLSARCWQVRPFGFSKSRIPVAITVEMRSGMQIPTLEQLTFAQAGRDKPEKAKLVSLPGNVQRVSWEEEFIVPKEEKANAQLAILTNLADVAVDTLPLRDSEHSDITVIFTALHEYASMGPSNVDSGAITDAIDTPLEIELDNYRARVQPGLYQKLDDAYVGVRHSDGIVNPCMLQVTGYTNRQSGVHFNNMLGITLQLSGPIRAGEYTVAPFSESSGDPSEILPPRQAVAGVVLTNMPEGTNDLQFETGTLVITHISPHLVVGNISGVGHHRALSYQTGNYEIVETRTLAAKFSIRVNGVLGKYRDGDFQCIDSSKPD